MLVLRFILLLSTTLFTKQIFGYVIPACTESSNGRLPYLESCTKFFECLNGQVMVHSCRPGLAFNPLSAECDLPQNVPGCENTQVQENAVIVCPRGFIGQVPHPKDCTQYTRCYRGITHYMICGPGYVYNIETGSCGLKENVPGCQGDLGNGINFRGDVSLPSQSARSVWGKIKPYDGYHPRVPCSTPGCLPINGHPPRVNGTSPSMSLLPLNQPLVPFRQTEMKESTSNPIIKNSFTTTDTATTMVNDEDKSSKQDDTIISDLYSGEAINVKIASPYDEELVTTTTTETTRPSSEVENLINNVTPKVTESFDSITPGESEATTDLSEEGLRESRLSQPEINKNSDSKVNSRFIENGRSVDSSDSWFKKLWSSDSNTIENNDDIKKKESNENASEDDSKSSNKNGVVNGKESTFSTSPAKSDSHQPYYVLINGTRYHYIYEDVQIDQNHSKIRSYNNAPLANLNVSKVTSQIDGKSINLAESKNQLMSSLETEPPFPFSYTPPIYFRSLRNIPKLTPLSGQSIRLRGGSNLNHGYVEVQGSKPGWGVICHTAPNWTLREAELICHQLGYSNGAQMVWKGRYNYDDIHPWVATSYVECQGTETWFQTCKFRDNSECNVQQDLVGIRCRQNNNTHCHENEVFYGGHCYYLAKSNSSWNYEEAARHCSERFSSLLYITSQKENDFLSEWLIRQHPDIESVTLGGLGFPGLNQSHWIWKDSLRTRFFFSKWWPGWDNEKITPPSVVSGVSCITMKKEFPCSDNQNTKCHTDYFFWDTEVCGIPRQNSAHICKRSNNDNLFRKI